MYSLFHSFPRGYIWDTPSSSAARRSPLLMHRSSGRREKKKKLNEGMICIFTRTEGRHDTSTRHVFFFNANTAEEVVVKIENIYKSFRKLDVWEKLVRPKHHWEQAATRWHEVHTSTSCLGLFFLLIVKNVREKKNTTTTKVFRDFLVP